jgi:hypothetical protein
MLMAGLTVSGSASPAQEVATDGASVIQQSLVEGPTPHFGLSQTVTSVLPFLAPPILPPPPLGFIPPPPPPLLPPPPPAPMAQRATMPEVPVIPEADSLILLVGGLAAFGGLAALRVMYRRRHDDID